jgi:FAD/FMN-containing dehydrogenase
VDANSVDDIVKVLTNPAQYPDRVRAAGSNHSAAPCGVAGGGTLIRMKMNRILEVGPDTLTVEAGARHLDMARQLEQEKLQFLREHGHREPYGWQRRLRRNQGSSFPGEYGQVRSTSSVCKPER